MNAQLLRPWFNVASLPSPHQAVEVRFADGSSDYLLWTGENWFPIHPRKCVIAWRAVPERVEEFDIAV